MFFFLFRNEQFKPGIACEIINVGLPTFNDEIGRKIIITKVMHEEQMVWAYDAKPIKYRQNRFGRWVTEFDPRCVESLYKFDQIRVLPEDESKELLTKLRVRMR